MNIIKKYAEFVSYHPWLILFLVLIITGFSIYSSSKVGTKSSDESDALPDDIEIIKAFDIIGDSFGGSDSVLIAIEINPNVPGSNEARDLRDPEIIKYLTLLTELVVHTDDVTSATSIGSILKKMNNGLIPKSKSQIVELISSNPISSSYICDDFSMALVRISLTDQYDANELAADLLSAIDQLPIPPGIDVNIAGEILSGPVIEGQIGPDMKRTSNFSIVGILIILLLLFWSPRYAITPLVVIGVGILWAFGYFGMIGTNLSSQTSGAISMIMGIGIDFGIQTVVRFRQELKKTGPRRAMNITLNNVMVPMATTTLAALIGFRAMSMGDLTILAELANIMSVGVAACFLAAITVVPVMAIIGEQLNLKIRDYWRSIR